MRNKKVVIVAFMIAMIALVQIPISPVLGYQKEETPLYPISGSDVDNRALGGADGFAVAMTMDLPVAKMESTHGRVAFAVGLADPWAYYDYPKYWTFHPFVKEMWVKVEGDGDYEPSPGEIVDNTGTGGSSTLDFWIALELVGAIFTAYDIANRLLEVYQEPPSQEWDPELHSVKAIVRQTGQPQFDPRLQTASIWLDNYFKRDGWNTLTITAGAESWVRAEVYDLETGFRYSWYVHSGTYQVAYEVSFVVGRPPNTPSKPSGTTSGYVGESYTYFSDAIDPEEDNIRFQFDWGDGSTPTTTGWYPSGATGSASHSWGSSGTYNVEVRAQDEYGLWSDWSPYLTVNIVEPTLVTILNTLGFTNIQESTVETFVPGTYIVKLYAEFSGQHAQNELSWYKVGTTQYNQIFSGPEGNYGYVDPPIVKSITINDQFGLSFLSWFWRYFTETSKNLDGIKHAMIYRNLDNPNMYLIGFENHLGGGDQDYNDMVVSITELVNLNLVVKVPQAPQEGVKVWVDDNTYTAYESDPVSIVVDGGEHEIEVQESFIEEGWVEGTYYIYTFHHWSDGSTDNPRTIHLTSDTTLTAYYLRSEYGIQSEEPQ